MWQVAIALAAQSVGRGGVIAYPTDTIPGLGCDPLRLPAVERILALKGRGAERGLILLAGGLELCEPWLEALEPPERARLAAAGGRPTTWLIPPPQWAPPWLAPPLLEGDGERRLALRITSHRVAQALTRTLGGPVVSTSINRSGEPPERHLGGIRRRFGAGVDFILPGPSGGGRPSRIQDLRTGRIVRE